MPASIRPCLLLFLILLQSCEKFVIPPVPPEAVKVTALVVEAKTIPITFDFIGIVESSHEVEIRSRVAGILIGIGFKEGGRVKKNDLLFQIDPEPFIIAYDRSKAQLAQQEAILWEARRAVARYEPLYKEKAASKRDLDNAVSKEMSTVASAQSAQSEVSDAVVKLGYTSITSPVTGLVGMSNFREGALIAQNTDILTTVSVTDPIWIRFNISERDVLQSEKDISKGSLYFPQNEEFTTEVILADKTMYPEKGKVNFTAPSYDSKTGTMRIRATFPNPNNVLRPGQFVTVRALGAKRLNAVAVPIRAVQQSKNGLFVYVVNDKNEAELRLIEAGNWVDDEWIVNEGLKSGEQIIVDGVNKVREGTKLIIKSLNKSTPSPASATLSEPPAQDEQVKIPATESNPMTLKMPPPPKSEGN